MKLLGKYFDTAFSAPNGIERLRELIMNLAVQGKLVSQEPNEQPPKELLQEIGALSRKSEGSHKTAKIHHYADLDTSPYNLPIGWELVKIKQITTKIGSGSTPRGGKSAYVSDGIPFLRSQNVWNDGLRMDNVAFISEETHEKMAATKVMPMDILLNITGASLGRCALVPDDFEEANVSQHVTIIRSADKNLRSFLHLLLLSPYCQKKIWTQQVGMSREGLSKKVLEQFILPIPPLEEQHRIVAKIDQLMTRCDELEKLRAERDRLQVTVHKVACDRLLTAQDPDTFTQSWQFITQHFSELYSVKENVTELRKAILQLAVMGKLIPQNSSEPSVVELLQKIEKQRQRSMNKTKIRKRELFENIGLTTALYDLPASWQWVRLGDLIDLVSGQHLKPNEYNEDEIGFSYYTGPADFGEESPKATRWTTIDRAIAIKGDILLTVKGAGVGKTNILVEEKAAISRQLMALRVTVINRSYLLFFLQTIFDQLQSLAVGIAIPGIGREDVLSRSFPLPPLPEQHRIVAKVDQLMTLCDTLEQQIDATTQKQTALLNAVINQI